MELNHNCNGHAHFRLDSFFAKLQKLENLLFQTPPWDFVPSTWNVARMLYSWTWSKAIKRILLSQKNVQIINKQISVASYDINTKSLFLGCYELNFGH